MLPGLRVTFLSLSAVLFLQFFGGKCEECESQQFACASGDQCIPQVWKCDQDADCRDGSDEIDCPPLTCSASQYKCKTTNRCIPRGWRCDGEDDCGDNSDEEVDICPTVAPFSCAANQVQCLGETLCIHVTQLCDNKVDCTQDGSDEGAHCTNQNACRSANCNYGCKEGPTGAQCYCQDGYKVSGTACIDVNECEEIVGVCEQICYNNEGSYQCSCMEGYISNGDQCTADTNEEGKLIIANSVNIQTLLLNGSDAGFSYIPATRALALDFYHSKNYVCWIDHSLGPGDIKLKCVDGTTMEISTLQELEIFFYLDNVEQFAIDWITGNFYFVDDVANRIFVCRPGTSVCITIIDTDLVNPRGIALDPNKGVMFFTDWGSQPKVESANMDGTDRRPLVTTKVVFPHGVTLDYAQERVYWVDAYLDYIEAMDYDGTNRRTVVNGVRVEHLYGITMFELYLYATNWHDNSIVKVNKFDGTVEEIATDMSRAGAIQVYHQYRQQEGDHPCKANDGKGDCAHICIILPDNGKACSCASGHILANDGKTCTDCSVVGMSESNVQMSATVKLLYRQNENA
ncbi:prolow-density lipoprotein receptor-related protein 1-like [Glandiceps talaboti]